MKRNGIQKIATLLALYSLAKRYIDPNTGGLIFQMLAVLFGLISGILLFFSGQVRMVFARMKRFVRERNSQSHDLTEAGKEHAGDI